MPLSKISKKLCHYKQFHLVLIVMSIVIVRKGITSIAEVLGCLYFKKARLKAIIIHRDSHSYKNIHIKSHSLNRVNMAQLVEPRNLWINL